MDMFSLRTVIDDILLLVRNNNISESEDLSRAQIASWILLYKAALLKAKKEADDKRRDEDSNDTSLTEMLKELGPLQLIDCDPDNCCNSCKRTKYPIPELLNKDGKYLFSVRDETGLPIQNMSMERKYYHRFRKYTYGELTYDYDVDEKGDGWITIHGINDLCCTNYIFIKGIFSDEENDESADEDDVKIPGWMIPDIKNNILKNELTFMLGRISDDDNNSTLDGIKPQQDSQIGLQK